MFDLFKIFFLKYMIKFALLYDLCTTLALTCRLKSIILCLYCHNIDTYDLANSKYLSKHCLNIFSDHMDLQNTKIPNFAELIAYTKMFFRIQFLYVWLLKIILVLRRLRSNTHLLRVYMHCELWLWSSKPCVKYRLVNLLRAP